MTTYYVTEQVMQIKKKNKAQYICYVYNYNAIIHVQTSIETLRMSTLCEWPTKSLHCVFYNMNSKYYCKNIS